VPGRRSFARWPGRQASGRCWCPHEALGSGRGVAGGAMLTWSKCRSGTRRAAPPRSRRARGSAARRWWHPHSSTTSQRPDDGVRVVVVPGSEVAVERVSRGTSTTSQGSSRAFRSGTGPALWRSAICCRAAGRSAHLRPPHCRSGGRPARHLSAGFVVRRGWLAGGGAARTRRRCALRQRMGQGVEQAVAGPEVGRGGPDPPARDEFEDGAGG
jgi:hypothetical protein